MEILDLFLKKKKRMETKIEKEMLSLDYPFWY